MARCRLCASIQGGSKRPNLVLQNRELIANGERKCTECLAVKPLTEYDSNGTKVGGTKSKCRDCLRAKRGHARHPHYDDIELNNRLIGQEIKKCLICKEIKPYAEYYNYKSGIGGKHPWCKACHLRKTRMAKYRLTMEEVIAGESIPRCQSCDIELDTGPRAERHFDHCHLTGKFRAVICEPCNITLGQFDEDPTRIVKLAVYATKIWGDESFQPELPTTTA